MERHALYLCLLITGCGFEHGSLGADNETSPDAAGTTDELHTSTFQQGVAGYANAQDTFLDQTSTDNMRGGDEAFQYDADAEDHKATIGLLRFDGIAAAIPAGAVITAATITLDITDAGDKPGELHAALVDWSQATTTWNNFGGDPGVQADEMGPMIEPLPIAAGMQSFDVTTSLQSGTSFGWLLIAKSPNAVEMRSSECSDVALRPSLSVTWHR